MKITLDPGHGQYDNRGIVPGFYEGTNNFILAGYLRDELSRYDVETVMTRNSVSDDPGVNERGRSAAENGSDVFLSIHSNAFSNETAHGVSAFYSVKRPGSKKLLEALADAVAEIMGSYNRGVAVRLNQAGNDYYGVIRSSVTSPKIEYSYIIEHGFHSNLEECTFLADKENLKKIAKAEADIIAGYFDLRLKNELKKGDLVAFKGGYQYNSANAEKADRKAGASLAVITAITPDALHPYHVRKADGSGGIINGLPYGYVDAAAISPAGEAGQYLTVGDVVFFKGGNQYNSPNTDAVDKNVGSSKAVITAVSKGAKHPYHIRRADEQGKIINGNPYGYVDLNAVSPIDKGNESFLDIGDFVTFKGGIQYNNPNTDTADQTVKESLAVITGVQRDAKHPYHLRKADSTGKIIGGLPYGYVDRSAVELILKADDRTGAD